MQQTEMNRKKLAEDKKEESRRNDMRQHANKLIQGFEKLDENQAKRAIWELFQNAVDLSSECRIIIHETEKAFEFSHNGKPFNSNTLDCLIKQVSSKTGQPEKDDQENKKQVGQYGTGFITTHSFGRRILLKGSIVEGDFFFKLDGFELDRRAKDSDELIEKLGYQTQEAFRILESGTVEEQPATYTTLSYQHDSTLEREYAKESLASLRQILPYVMVINERLKEVEVRYLNGKIVTYTKHDQPSAGVVNIAHIHIDEEKQQVFYLRSGTPEDEIKVILPLSAIDQVEQLPDEVPRLFLFYPLIGTEKFGFNFIVHADKFAPTEPRDGIHLNSTNAQVKEKEAANRIIMDRASEMIFDYLAKHTETINNPIHLSTIDFPLNHEKTELQTYFKLLNNQWVSRFKSLRLVETADGRITPQEAAFFHRELLQDGEKFSSIYDIVNHYWKNIPDESIAKEWTKRIAEWDAAEQQFTFITVEKVVDRIQASRVLSEFEEKELKEFYEYLVSHSFIGVFSNKRLLPNIKKDFREIGLLNSSLDIDEVLVEVADVIMPDVPKRYIHSGFIFKELGVLPYKKKQFQTDLNSHLSERKRKLTQESLFLEAERNALIKFCSIFPDVENMGSMGKLMPKICEYYGIDFNPTEIPGFTEELNPNLARITLTQNFVLDISTQPTVWIEKNISFLQGCLEIITGYQVFKDDRDKWPLFPNQRGTFCPASQLRIDNGIPSKLADCYNAVVLSGNGAIEAKLAHKELASYLPEETKKETPQSLGSEIEQKFAEAGSITEIEEHKYKGRIFWAIEQIIDDKTWATYFPVVDGKKEVILMAKISDGETKSDLFSILSLEGKDISILGELARSGNLKELVEAGKNAVEEKKRANFNFQFKHKIGKRIEDTIRENLGVELDRFKVEAPEEQDTEVFDQQIGQDIIIKMDGIPIYFIEVKSRWSSETSITMSPRQLRTAANNQNQYALCCVDMVDYLVGQAQRYEVEDISLIIDRIKILPSIGEMVFPLIEKVPEFNVDAPEITLTGDYRAIIPQEVVKTGISLDHLVGILKDKILTA